MSAVGHESASLATPAASVATTVLAILAIVVALWWGRSFLVPMKDSV